MPGTRRVTATLVLGLFITFSCNGSEAKSLSVFPVASVTELESSLLQAKPGDEIVIMNLKKTPGK